MFGRGVFPAEGGRRRSRFAHGLAGGFGVGRGSALHGGGYPAVQIGGHLTGWRFRDRKRRRGWCCFRPTRRIVRCGRAAAGETPVLDPDVRRALQVLAGEDEGVLKKKRIHVISKTGCEDEGERGLLGYPGCHIYLVLQQHRRREDGFWMGMARGDEFRWPLKSSLVCTSRLALSALVSPLLFGLDTIH